MRYDQFQKVISIALLAKIVIGDSSKIDVQNWCTCGVLIILNNYNLP